MIYERGRLITPDPTAADAFGQLELELHPTTTTLWVEWSAAHLPQGPGFPYRRRYAVALGSGSQEATRNRLANLGFSANGRLADSVREFQRANGQPPSGNIRDVEEDVRHKHDDGLLTPFLPVPRPTQASSEHPVVRSFFEGPIELGLDDKQAADPLAPSSPSKAKTGGGKQNPQGAAVGDTADIYVIVAVEPKAEPIKPSDITVRLRPILVPKLPAGQADKLVEPSELSAGLNWQVLSPEFVAFRFDDMPQGQWDVLVHIDKVKSSWRKYALGHETVSTGASRVALVYVPATGDRPILMVNDPLLELDVKPMQRRRKVLATYHHTFPRSANFQAKKQRIKPDYDQGEFQRMLERPTSGNSCTSVNGAIMNAAAGPGKYAYNIPKSPGFVPYQSGRVPSVGDSFVLMAFKNPNDRHHTGLVVQSSAKFDSLWLTADGGQRDQMSKPVVVTGKNGRDVQRGQVSTSREAAFIVPRIFGERKNPGHGQLGNLHVFPASEHAFGWYIEGWLDITHPHVPFSKLAYDKLGTEQDFKKMKERVARVAKLVAIDRAAAKAML